MMDKWRFYRLKEMKFCFPIIRRHEARLCVCVFVCILKIGLAEGRRSATESQTRSAIHPVAAASSFLIYFSPAIAGNFYGTVHIAPSQRFYVQADNFI
jgi:hypothetical protein